MSRLVHLDTNALPLKTPLLLMTAEGSLLEDDSMVPLVELQQKWLGRGMLEIRRSGAPRVLTGGGGFSHEYDSVQLEPFSTPSGMVVFKNRYSDRCLSMSTGGQYQSVDSYAAYEGSGQEWHLLRPVLPATASFRLKDLATTALSDPTARRKLTWCLLEAGNPYDMVTDIVKLLYGTVNPKADLSVAERQEQALLKLIYPYSSQESIRAMKVLVGGANLPLPTEDPATSMVKSEQATVDAKYAADGDSSSEGGDQYVAVGSASLKPAGFDAIPLNSPLVMVSSTGCTLNTLETGSGFVELKYRHDGLVTIHSAADKSKCLVLNAYRQCVFGSEEFALMFEEKLSPSGRLVLVESCSGCVLETEVQGRTRLVVCRNLYSTESQSWLLFAAHTLPSSLAPSGLQKPTYSPDARRQFIMELALTRKRSKQVGGVLKLMCASETMPSNTPVATDAIRVERVQQILELFEGRVKTETIEEYLKMMYGTSSPL